MKVSVTSCLALVALACLLPSGLAQNDAFEDCATTTFKIANNRVYVSADVFKYTKLRTGQGSMDCMALCRANDECWSFNFDKSKKWCYLISEEGSSTKTRRRQLWSSGYKVCVAHSDDDSWDNTPTDSATLEATELEFAPTESGAVAFSWKAASATTGYNGEKKPNYRVVCGDADADWHCDETPLWASAKTISTSLTVDIDNTIFDSMTDVKCFVETYVNGVKVACSDGATQMVGPIPTDAVLSVSGGRTYITFTGNPYYEYQVFCSTDGSPPSSAADTEDISSGSFSQGSYPASQSLYTVGTGADYVCVLAYKPLGAPDSDALLTPVIS